MGSGQNGQLTLIDLLSILSFAVGLQNLELNIDQNDLTAQTQEIDKKANKIVNNAIAEIHAHLEMQDRKIDRILSLIGGKNEDYL